MQANDDVNESRMQTYLNRLFWLLICGTAVSCSPKTDSAAKSAEVQAVKAESEWYKVVDIRGGFKAAFPEQPVITTNIINTSIGPIEQRLFMAEPRGTVAFAVMYSSVSPTANAVSIIQNVCDTSARDSKVLTQRELELGGRIGREIIMEKLDGQALVTLRAFISSNHLYLISVVVPVKEPFKEQTSQFFDAFSFVD